MRRLKKPVFMQLMGSILLVLFVIRLCHPEVNGKQEVAPPVADDAVAPPVADDAMADDFVIPDSAYEQPAQLPLNPPSFRKADGTPLKHRIFSVSSYRDCFPDVQDVHFPAAVANGVRPVQNREEADLRKSDLLYVGANPYYELDPGMSSSIPYLVPRASMLLQDVGRRFMDSLAVKGIPLHTIIVTSVLRTEDDVTRLRRINGNASEQSCHRFATTFDISYNRYHTVSPPDQPQRRAVRNDSLKFVLSEVLRDMRESNRCFIKYEVKQGCFHVTVR